MIYIYMTEVSRWMIPNCDQITMGHIFNDICSDFEEEHLIYVGY